jgi:hypothetical protein
MVSIIPTSLIVIIPSMAFSTRAYSRAALSMNN